MAKIDLSCVFDIVVRRAIEEMDLEDSHNNVIDTLVNKLKTNKHT